MIRLIAYHNKIYNMVLNVGFGKFDSKYHIYAITNDVNKRKVADSKSPAGSVDNLLKSDFSINNISQNEGKRNTEKSISELDTAGRTLTYEQQKYFKDSKVRNNAGRLRVMYHGTNADTFTVFDKKMIGSNFTGAFGNGFYFSAKRSDAMGFGKNIIRAYLNIKNPYYAKSSG